MKVTTSFATPVQKSLIHSFNPIFFSTHSTQKVDKPQGAFSLKVSCPNLGLDVTRNDEKVREGVARG